MMSQFSSKFHDLTTGPLDASTIKTIGGMCGGAVEAVALQPLDTIKTRVQLSMVPGMGPVAIAKHTIRHEGVGALYKGLTPFLAHLTSKYALRFYVNELYRNNLTQYTSLNSQTMGFVAGLGAGVTEAVLIVTPFEVIKTRLQQQRGTTNLKYHGPIHCAKTIVATEGAGALWKGVAPTMARQGLNQCFLFGCYDILKQNMWDVSRDAKLEPEKALLTGMVAGMIGPMVNCPVDVAKTRLMGQQTVAGAAPKYTGMFQTMNLVAKEEGVAALYRGLLPRIARVAPGQGITFMVMEQVVRSFQN
jgi:solute carrier family 25 citrate transporter 1